MLTVSDKPRVSMVADPSVSPATEPSPKLLSQVTAGGPLPGGEPLVSLTPTGMAANAEGGDEPCPGSPAGSSSQ